MKKLSTLILLFAMAFSCKDAPKETTQMKEVMAIHDEVMPSMGKMGKMVGELSSKEDSTELGVQYKKARIDLQEAHKAMMDWMQNFGNRFNADEILNGKALSEQKQEWLNEEEDKVKDLREQINSSIEKAEKLLAKEE